MSILSPYTQKIEAFIWIRTFFSNFQSNNLSHWKQVICSTKQSFIFLRNGVGFLMSSLTSTCLSCKPLSRSWSCRRQHKSIRACCTIARTHCTTWRQLWRPGGIAFQSFQTICPIGLTSSPGVSTTTSSSPTTTTILTRLARIQISPQA